MSTLQFYISNGVVDVVATVAAVMLLVQFTKPIIESIGCQLSRNPLWPHTAMHDSVIELWALALSLAATGFLWNAGPGFHTNLDYGVWFLNTVVAVASAFGIYSKLHPFPVTPTQGYLAHARLGMQLYAEQVAASQGVPPVKPPPV